MSHASEHGLLVGERRRRICELLRAEGRVRVDALAFRFGTSQVTIRADLSTLEMAGALTRTHGGALNVPDADQPLSVKQLQHRAEKLRIAEAAAALIRDGETLILDSGTTTAEIARRVRNLDLQSINVITNALNIAAVLIDVPSVRLIVPGGILRRESNSLSGPMAEAALGALRADRLFLGADGVDAQLGVMTPHLAEAELNAKMIAMSRQVVVVADSSKFGRVCLHRILEPRGIGKLVTDAGISADTRAELVRIGIEVIIA